MFARREIAADEVLERVPVLLIPRAQVFGPGEVAQRAARISWYVFGWIKTKRDYVAQAGLPEEFFFADSFTSAADKV